MTTATPDISRGFVIKPLHIAAVGIIVIAIVYGIFGLKEGFRAYTTSVSEAQTSGRSVQLAGFLGSKGTYDSKGHWTFMLQDKDGKMVKVVSNEPKPANFEKAVSIVAIGRYSEPERAFMADSLLVKCPSKYQEQLGQPNA